MGDETHKLLKQELKTDCLLQYINKHFQSHEVGKYIKKIYQLNTMKT